MARTRYQKKNNAEKPHPRVTLIVNKSNSRERNPSKGNKQDKPGSRAGKTPATNPPSLQESLLSTDDEPRAPKHREQEHVRQPSPTVEEIQD